jgi:hypothetical protein
MSRFPLRSQIPFNKIRVKSFEIITVHSPPVLSPLKRIWGIKEVCHRSFQAESGVAQLPTLLAFTLNTSIIIP